MSEDLGSYIAAFLLVGGLIIFWISWKYLCYMDWERTQKEGINKSQEKTQKTNSQQLSYDVNNQVNRYKSAYNSQNNSTSKYKHEVQQKSERYADDGTPQDGDKYWRDLFG